MPRKKKTIKVVSIGNVKCDGKYHRPGKEWDCPHDYVGQLEEVGAVERIRMISEKKTTPKTKAPKTPSTTDNTGSEEDDKDQAGDNGGQDDSGAQDKDIPNDGTGNQE